jgi:lipopolysaccharide transport system permease protein
MTGLMIYYQYVPSWQIVYLPVFLIIAFLASFGAGLWLTTMTVKYRDFRYIVPFIVQLGLYISPVGFSSSIVPEKWRLLYSLNPMVGVIDGFRWCLLGGESKIYMQGFILSLGVTLLLMWYAVRHFRKMEKAFADYI